MKRFSAALLATVVAVVLLMGQRLFRADAEPTDGQPPFVEGRSSDSEGDARESLVMAARVQPSSEDGLEEVPSEAKFLERLDRLNVVDKEGALQFAQRGEDWFGDSGEGAEARRAMEITLLVDLGRMSDARAEVRRFIDRYPDSRYRPLVQGVTGVHPRPGPPAHVLD